MGRNQAGRAQEVFPCSLSQPSVTVRHGTTGDASSGRARLSSGATRVSPESRGLSCPHPVGPQVLGPYSQIAPE